METKSEIKPRILVVDDELLIRRVLCAALQQENYDIDEADSGEKALEKLAHMTFDVVLTDITMAQVSGIDLLFAIKKKSPETEVILITGYASLETAEKAVAGQAYRYLRKPFDDLEDVLKVVADALQAGQQHKKKEAQLQDLIFQRDRLQKQLGKAEVMYAISHAVGFPEDPAAAIREVTLQLVATLGMDLTGCYLPATIPGESGKLFLFLLRPLEHPILQHLIATLRQETGSGQVACLDILASEEKPPASRLGRLVEIPFPKQGNLSGTLYIGFAQDRKLSDDEKQLLEVAVAQVAGAIKKFYEFHDMERQRLQMLIEGMIDGVILFKQGSKISLANQAALSLFHAHDIVELEESIKKLGWIQHSSLILFKPGDHLNIRDQASFALLNAQILEDWEKRLNQLGWVEQPGIIQQSQWAVGKELEMPDGRILSVTVLPLGDRWEASSTLILRDITDQRRIQQEVERTRRLSSIGELAADVAHELNNPLTVISGYTELAMEQDITPELKEDLKRVLDEAHRCQKMVQNLLALAPSKNQQKLLVNVQELIEKTLSLTRVGLNKAKVVSAASYPKEKIWVTVDGSQIQQVLFNLVKNAKEAMEAQTNKAHKLELKLVLAGDKAHIQVCDNGPGISGEYQEKIFNPFFTTKPPGKGTGLGLSISHKIVREHGGRLWHTNNPEGGAIFTIELPVTKIE